LRQLGGDNNFGQHVGQFGLGLSIDQITSFHWNDLQNPSRVRIQEKNLTKGFTDLAPCKLIPCIFIRVVWRREYARVRTPTKDSFANLVLKQEITKRFLIIS